MKPPGAYVCPRCGQRVQTLRPAISLTCHGNGRHRLVEMVAAEEHVTTRST